MKLTPKKQRVLVIFIILLIVAGVGVTAYYLLRGRSVKSFNDCVKAGYPVMQTDPEQCWGPNDKLFIQTPSSSGGTSSQSSQGEMTCPSGEYQYGIPYGCVPLDFCKTHSCSAVCLSSATDILTSDGEVNVKAVTVGMKVWSVNKQGQRILAPVIKIGSVIVPTNHQMIQLTLSSGRSLTVSPGHPAINGIPIAELRVGEAYDNAIVTSVTYGSYADTRTYDILPAGDTGFYFANGILVGSTLKQ